MTEHAVGDATGIAMPASVDALRKSPEVFLTGAMRAYGTLAPDNRVVAVDRLDVFPGGNSGQKALIDVSFAQDEPGLPRHLFVKFSRDFDDPFRDRRRGELESEVRLAALSCLPSFPIAVPRAVFADFHAASGTGLLITERIAFGEGNIEPLHHKCMDHLLPDPLEYYRALVSAQARLAAAQHTGALSPQLNALFPHDPGLMQNDLPIAYGAENLRHKISSLRAFIVQHPQLFPEMLTDPAFGAMLETDSLAFLQNEMLVRRFLHSDPRFVAVCHWNANIDNAWFWRDGEGELDCGLLDWGMVRWMNVATGLWGGFSAAMPIFLETELDGLLDHYRQELAVYDGPTLPRDLLDLHFDLSLAIVGLALMMDLPAIMTARVPKIAGVSGPLDPVLTQDKVVEGFLLVTTNFLNLWARRNFGRSLRRMLEL